MARFALLSLLLLSASPAFAHPTNRGVPYSVEVESESGHSLRTFHHQGQTFVLGENGSRYNIRVRNRTSERIEVVVTVDGRDVISGREGDYTKERGYVLGAYDDVLIEGFRTSEHSVAAFRFSDPEASYSSRMGTPQNVGIIGVAVFRERAPEVIVRRPRPVPYETHKGYRTRSARPKSSGSGSADHYSGEAPAAAPSSEGLASSSPRRGRPAPYYSDRPTSDRPSNLGTEYGEAQYSRVRSTRFVRENSTRPNRVITLRYDDEDGLLARGIRVRRVQPPPYAGPLAFPRNRFAPPPP